MTDSPVAIVPGELFERTLGSLDGLMRINSDKAEGQLASDLLTARMLIHNLRISARHA